MAGRGKSINSCATPDDNAEGVLTVFHQVRALGEGHDPSANSFGSIGVRLCCTQYRVSYNIVVDKMLDESVEAHSLDPPCMPKPAYPPMMAVGRTAFRGSQRDGSSGFGRIDVH